MKQSLARPTVARLLLAVFFMATGAAATDAQRAAAARPALADFDEFAAQAIAGHDLPGMAIAVVCGDQLVYARGFGFRDLEQQLPMTPETLFAISSTTKAFTTAVLGMLVDEGRLDWDEPVRTYLPELRLHDPTATELITPRDLVTHRSGLPDHMFMWFSNNALSRAELVARLRHLQPSAALRARFQYNNVMFIVAGHLIDRVTGGSWEQEVRTRIFEPLGMTRSNFSIDRLRADENHALAYYLDADENNQPLPVISYDLLGPAGGINSSVTEMSRWLRFHLRGGRVGDRQLITAATLAQIHSPQMVIGEGAEHPEISMATYGLGWFVDTYRGHRRLSHHGSLDGYQSSVMLFPDDDLGLITFANRNSRVPEQVNQHAADRILGLAPIDWYGQGLARRSAARAARKQAPAPAATNRRPGTQPSHDLAEYAGEYEHPAYGKLTVTLVDGALVLTFNGIRTRLVHWHYDVFNGDPTDPLGLQNSKFQFRADLDGYVASVESGLERAVDPIVFRKRPPAELFDPAHVRRLAARYQTPWGPLVVSLAGGRLTATLASQAPWPLVPTLSGRFRMREDARLSLDFELDAEGNVTGAKIYGPTAVYQAPRSE